MPHDKALLNLNFKVRAGGQIAVRDPSQFFFIRLPIRAQLSVLQ